MYWAYLTFRRCWPFTAWNSLPSGWYPYETKRKASRQPKSWAFTNQPIVGTNNAHFLLGLDRIIYIFYIVRHRLNKKSTGEYIGLHLFDFYEKHALHHTQWQLRIEALDISSVIDIVLNKYYISITVEKWEKGQRIRVQ